jgi:Lhr-like helicase
VHRGRLDEVKPPEAPLDILQQQAVAEVASRDCNEGELFEALLSLVVLPEVEGFSWRGHFELLRTAGRAFEFSHPDGARFWLLKAGWR